jgi:hypothetical protein
MQNEGSSALFAGLEVWWLLLKIVKRCRCAAWLLIGLFVNHKEVSKKMFPHLYTVKASLC